MPRKVTRDGDSIKITEGHSRRLTGSSHLKALKGQSHSTPLSATQRHSRPPKGEPLKATRGHSKLELLNAAPSHSRPLKKCWSGLEWPFQAAPSLRPQCFSSTLVAPNVDSEFITLIHAQGCSPKSESFPLNWDIPLLSTRGLFILTLRPHVLAP